MFRRLPWSAPLLSSFCFAVMAISVKVLVQRHLPSSEIVFLRSLLPTLLMLPLAFWEGRATGPKPRATWIGLGARGLCGAAAMCCYFVALAHAPTAIAVLTGNTSPLWTAVFATFFLRERAPQNLAWALPLALAGSGLVCMGQSHFEGGEHWVGAGLGLLSAVFSGMAYTYVRQLRSLPPSWVAISLTATACLVTIPFAPQWLWPQGSDWMWVLAVGVSSGLAQYWMTVGYHYNGAAQASTLGLCAVPFSSWLGLMLLRETITLVQCGGILAVLLGVLAVIPKERKP